MSDKRRSMGSDQEKRLAQGKKCTATDTKYFQAAENLLYVELGAALGKPKQIGSLKEYEGMILKLL